MICFHGLRLYRLAAAEADTSYPPPFGGAIFFSMVRMIELLPPNDRRSPPKKENANHYRLALRENRFTKAL